MTKPPLVIIAGAPGAGKSSIARPLARYLELPLFEKDAIKERIADALGDAAQPLSRDIGLAAVRQILDTARELLAAGQGVIIESTFHRGIAEPDLEPLLPWSNPVMVHLTAEPELILSRFETRMADPDRHPIHNDGSRIDELRDRLAKGMGQPLELDIPCIVIDTTWGKTDPEEIAFMVREVLYGEEE